MTAATTIAEIQAGPRERVRVSLGRCNDRDIVDIREVTPIASTVDVWARTKVGLSIDVALIPALRAALAAAESRARALETIEAAP